MRINQKLKVKMAIFMAVIIFVWGVGSLYLVALRTKAVRSVFLSKPSIVLGDFLILPFLGGLIAYAYESSGQIPQELFLPGLAVAVGLIGLVLMVISAVRNKLVNFWWSPHLLFYWFMSFWVLYYLVKDFNLRSLLWWVVVSGISIHQLLGIIFPKKFPKIS